MSAVTNIRKEAFNHN